MAAQRRPWRWIIAAVVVVVALAVAIPFFTAPKPDAKPYDLAPVTRSTQTDTVALSGKIAPRSQAEATFRVPGTVEQVVAKVGQKVTKGDDLARIDSADLTDALALARAQESAARAQLKQVRNAKGATASAIEAARAQVRSAEAATRSAETKLGYATLTAPIGGTVARVEIKVGDKVSGGGASLPTSMNGLNPGDLSGLTGGAGAGTGGGASAGTSGRIVIVATDAWQLDATIGTADLARLKRGQKATITPAGTTDHLPGSIDTVSIVSDPSATTPSYPVTVAIDPTKVALFSGSAADALVTVGTYRDVLTVPVEALRDDGTRTTVRLQHGEETLEREVELGRLFDGRREITAGLDEGDQVQIPKTAHTPSAPATP